MITPAVLFGECAGRAEELDALHGAYDRVRRGGKGAIVFIEGEAGIGKSRLLAEFASRSGPQGEIVVGRCERFGAPYRPFANIVARLRGRSEYAMHPLFRRAANTTNVSTALTVDRLQTCERRRIGAIVSAFETACDRNNGLAFVFDDAHWSDYASALAFVELGNLASRKPLLLVCAYRVSDLAGDERLAATFAQLAPRAMRIALGGLASSDVIRLVCEAAPSIDRFTAKRLCALSEGNPYVAEELSRSALESCAPNAAPIEIPTSLRAAILARLAAFTDDERFVLEASSVFANAIDTEALGAVCDVSQQELANLLDAACRAQLLERSIAQSNRPYRFRHALTREVVYRSLIVPQARALHRRLADELEAGNGDVAEIAYQRWSAHDTERGAAACEASGDRAMSLASTRDAANEYECALRLLRGDLDALERIGSKAIRALYLAGRTGDAANLCTRVAAQLECGGRFEQAAALLANVRASLVERTLLHIAQRKTCARKQDGADVAMRTLVYPFSHSAVEDDRVFTFMYARSIKEPEPQKILLASVESFCPP